MLERIGLVIEKMFEAEGLEFVKIFEIAKWIFVRSYFGRNETLNFFQNPYFRTIYSNSANKFDTEHVFIMFLGNFKIHLNIFEKYIHLKILVFGKSFLLHAIFISSKFKHFVF